MPQRMVFGAHPESRRSCRYTRAGSSRNCYFCHWCVAAHCGRPAPSPLPCPRTHLHCNDLTSIQQPPLHPAQHLAQPQLSVQDWRAAHTTAVTQTGAAGGLSARSAKQLHAFSVVGVRPQLSLIKLLAVVDVKHRLSSIPMVCHPLCCWAVSPCQCRTHLGVSQTFGNFFIWFCPPSNSRCGLPPAARGSTQKNLRSR